MDNFGPRTHRHTDTLLIFIPIDLLTHHRRLLLVTHSFTILHIFGTEEAIVDSSRNRFDEFPVHSKLFYKSYYDQMTAEEILDTIIIDENELDPTGFQQDSGLFGDDTPSYYGLFDCPAP